MSQSLTNQQVDLLSTKNNTLKGRTITGSGKAKNPTDLITLEHVQALIQEAISNFKPTNVTTPPPAKTATQYQAESQGGVGVIIVPNGGTGQSNFPLNAVLLGNGNSPLKNQAGVNGSLSLTLTIFALQYKDWAGVNQTLNVVTNVTLTTNTFTNGVRSA